MEKVSDIHKFTKRENIDRGKQAQAKSANLLMNFFKAAPTPSTSKAVINPVKAKTQSQGSFLGFSSRVQWVYFNKRTDVSDFEATFPDFQVKDRIKMAPINKFLCMSKSIPVQVNSKPNLSLQGQSSLSKV